MIRPSHLPNIEGLTWLGQDSTEENLWRFREDGSDSLRLILDYDRTLTNEYTTWDAGGDALPLRVRRKHRELRDENIAFESNGELSFERALVWSAQALQMHINARTPYRKLEREAKKVQWRNYGKMVFAVSERAGMPVAIFSSGILNVIEMNIDEMNKTEREAGRREIDPAARIGAKLLFENGRVVNRDFESVYATTGKRESNHPELVALRKERPNALVVGDQLHDYDMVEGNAVSLRLINEPVGTQRWRQKIDESRQKGFDGAIDGLKPVTEVIQWFSSQSGLLVPDSGLWTPN